MWAGDTSEIRTEWREFLSTLGTPATVTVAGKPNVDLPPGTLNSVLKQAGLKKKDEGEAMRYLVVVEQGPTSFGAYVPDLPGCVAAGETKAEALELVRGAIELHIRDLKSEGREVPEPTSVSEVVEVEAA